MLEITWEFLKLLPRREASSFVYKTGYLAGQSAKTLITAKLMVL